MPPPWILDWSSAAERELKKLDPPVARQIRDDIEAYAQTGVGDASRLKGSTAFRLRVGDWRVIFELDYPKKKLMVAHVGHRREIYR